MQAMNFLIHWFSVSILYVLFTVLYFICVYRIHRVCQKISREKENGEAIEKVVVANRLSSGTEEILMLISELFGDCMFISISAFTCSSERFH